MTNEFTITNEGFSLSIAAENREWVLRLDGGEWRCSGLRAPWIAQGRIDKWEALARTMRRIEEEMGQVT
jgi:hypothetical protein